METLIYILFICITIPLILMAFLVEKNSRRPIVFFIIGICAAVFASEINGILSQLLPLDVFDLTIRVTPITEEIIKALPVLFFAKYICTHAEHYERITIVVCHERIRYWHHARNVYLLDWYGIFLCQ